MLGDAAKDLAGDARPVGRADQFNADEVALDGGSADNDLLQVRSFFHDVGPFAFRKAAANVDFDAVVFAELDASRVHDLGAKRSQFEHFVIEDVIELAGLGDDSRI